MKGTNMKQTHTTIIDEILTSKADAGPDAYLWLNTSGYCILLTRSPLSYSRRSGDASQNDDGARAIGRWQLDRRQKESILDSGEVDELC